MLKDIWTRLLETVGLVREGYGGVCPCGPSCTCENCQCADCGC